MNPEIRLKSPAEVEAIGRSCRIAATILATVAHHIEEGVSTRQLDRIAAGLMRQFGVVPGVKAGFPGTICISVNEVAAHGVPSKQRLRRGDIISLDVAVQCEGWYGDVAATLAVGTLCADRARLITAAREALSAAVGRARAGACLGDLGAGVLEVAKAFGCSLLPEFVGHGIGRELHEEPVVSHAGRKGEGLRLLPGMVFTLEPALALGSPEIRRGLDGWSLRTVDGSAVAQFEHTVAVLADRTEVLSDVAGWQAG